MRIPLLPKLRGAKCGINFYVFLKGCNKYFVNEAKAPHPKKAPINFTASIAEF
jgi:hypothetical protein